MYNSNSNSNSSSTTTSNNNSNNKIGRRKHIRNNNRSRKKKKSNFKPYAFVMACNNDTENDCFDLQLLGGPKSCRRLSGNIVEGTPLVLYNFESDICYLPITAKGPMQDNINSNAWGGKFPCQIKCDLSECGYTTPKPKNKPRAGYWIERELYDEWYHSIPWSNANQDSDDMSNNEEGESGDAQENNKLEAGVKIEEEEEEEEKEEGEEKEKEKGGGEEEEEAEPLVPITKTLSEKLEFEQMRNEKLINVITSLRKDVDTKNNTIREMVTKLNKMEADYYTLQNR